MSILGMYVQSEIYPSPETNPTQVVSSITKSKLTTPILSLFHVGVSKETCHDLGSSDSQDGDITFNDTLILRDGQYVGDTDWPSIVQSLRTGKVSKIFASFGGYGVKDYHRIQCLIDHYGTGKDSPLYKNFACLQQTLGLDGIDFDDEDLYDVKTTVQLAQMLLGMGLEITFCPYMDKEFWFECVGELKAQGHKVSWLNLQCYAGGKSNDPGAWTGKGVPVVAGVCADCCCEQTTCSVEQVRCAYSVWTTGQGSVDPSCWKGSVSGPARLAGGFMWTYGEVADDLDDYVDAMATGLAGSKDLSD